MVGHFTESTESVVATGADAHGAAWFLHDGCLAARARAVHDICHQVQAGLQEQAVVTCKQLLSNQLLNLNRDQSQVTGTGHSEPASFSEKVPTAGVNPLYIRQQAMKTLLGMLC